MDIKMIRGLFTIFVFISIPRFVVSQVPAQPTQYSLRLTGVGSSAVEGRVEIFYNNTWGSLCGLGFTTNEGNVVCRQLGFNQMQTYFRTTTYGEGSAFWLRMRGCVGDESAIHECSHDPWGDESSCSGDYGNVGVRCTASSILNTYGVRLAGSGSSESEGRVEINFNGQWGTVCGDYWDEADAAVVCRQLGYEGPAVSNINAYGRGYGPIWLDNVHCPGYGYRLAACAFYTWGSHNCDHTQDAGVQCSTIDNIDDLTVRLAGTGSSFREGRVEIFRAGRWGTMCDRNFDVDEANVVCRQLGFGGADDALSGSFYGAGSGVIQLELLSGGCDGDEANLDECNHKAWGSNYCTHDQDASVRCSVEADLPRTYSVRLVSGSDQYPSQGRVEINFHGQWGTVCGDSWDNVDAAVVCNQLGFTGASTARSGVHGQGSGTIWLDDVECTAEDQSLAGCVHNGWGINNCDHTKDAGVICTSASGIDDYSVRLTGIRSTYREGRVEVFFNGRWGSVCHDAFGMQEANVVCRQLGFPGALSYQRNGYYGDGSGMIWLDDVTCSGNEMNLKSCSHGPIGDHDCTHSDDVGVVCDTTSSFASRFAVRLAGSSNANEGRVEVNYYGQWGTICDVAWQVPDATVVCRQLGFSGAQTATTGSRYGKGTGTIWAKNTACTGNETFLVSCPNDGWGNAEGCSHDNEAGVICRTTKEADDYAVRLSGAGSTYNAGRVEIYYGNRWGTICDNSWDTNDASVVCKMLGFKSAKSAPRGAYYGQGSGPVWLDGLTCTGGETSLNDCGHIGFGNLECDHVNDASVVCSDDRTDTNPEGTRAPTPSSKTSLDNGTLTGLVVAIVGLLVIIVILGVVVKRQSGRINTLRTENTMSFTNVSVTNTNDTQAFKTISN